MVDLLAKAKRIAEEAHKGQTRLDGTTPFIIHPEAVAKQFEKAHPNYQMTALLHDVCEDNHGWTFARLLEDGIPERVVAAVDALTHREGESYPDYIERVKKDIIAKEVKIEDIKHNLSTSTDEQMKNKRIIWMLALKLLQYNPYHELYGGH